jgi:hypothetical protein
LAGLAVAVVVDVDEVEGVNVAGEVAEGGLVGGRGWGLESGPEDGEADIDGEVGAATCQKKNANWWDYAAC